MKNTALLFCLVGFIGLSGCYDSFQSDSSFMDIDSHSICPAPTYTPLSITPCVPDYVGPGEIVTLSNGEEPNDHYDKMVIIDSDENNLYLHSQEFGEEELIAIDKFNGLLAYRKRLPQSLKWHFNGKHIQSFQNEFWVYHEEEILAFDKKSGSQIFQQALTNRYKEISRSEDGYLASQIVDCSDNNFINLDLIDPHTGLTSTFYSESLDQHTGAGVTYLGKFMDRGLLDLFLVNTHSSEKKENKIIAIDVRNKAKVWEQKLHFVENIFASRNQFSIQKGIFMIGADDRFYAYDLKNKAALQFNISIDGMHRYYQLTQTEKSFVLFGGRKQILLVSSEDGSIINSINTGPGSINSLTGVAVSNNRLFVNQVQHGLSIIDLDTFEIISEIRSPRSQCADWGSEFRNTPHIDNGSVFLSDYNEVYSLSLEEADLAN